MAHQKPVGKFIHRDDAEVIAKGGNTIATLLAEAETAGRFAVREVTVVPGAAPVPQLSVADNRYVFVVAGEWEIQAGSESRIVRDGVSIFVPAGSLYTARLIGTREGRLLEITAPIARSG
jgi:mannose-6-phosphate isomerase-like protein (cupin superfamily)